MDQLRWQHIKDLFAAASAVPSPERAAFLARECPDDPEMREEVLSLLAHQPTADGDGSQRIAAEGVMSRVGPYRILQEIGEGGFGTVYLAEQEHPVRRRVALKVIKAGMDSRQIVARFEQERQALALMDHPGIARVLDAGTSESGRPYFVMELVRGDPITAYCDRERLSTRERLELFVEVCRAVQHAHGKGVIHRDIKPSNVLVTIVDGRPMPKVIDFGVAKATQGPLTDKTLFTEHRQLLGTPLYMSPEQAYLSGVDVDTRSDVYSLGVLLYELLTGVPPLDQSELLQAGVAEIHRMIRELEPKKPSTRFATMGPASDGIARHRQIEAKRLGLLLQGDLDWIAMRCLEKERARRYETASDLARDIERHLGGEPIEAAPPSALYRARKLVRRRRGAFVGTAVVGLVAVLGIGSTLVQSRRAQLLAERSRIAETERANEAVRTAAEQQALRREADAQRAEAEVRTYIANITAANAAWIAGDANAMRDRLAACAEERRGWEWRQLKARADMAVGVLRDRRALLDIDWEKGVAPHPDGEFADLWDAERLLVLEPPLGVRPGSVLAASRATGRTLVAAFEWTGEHQPIVSVFAVDGSKARIVAELTLAPSDWKRSLPPGYDLVVGGFSPDGRWLMTLAPAASCEIWNTTTWERACTVSGAYWTFSNDGSRLLRRAGHAVEIVDPADGGVLARLATPGSNLLSCRFSPDGSKVVATSVTGVVRVWDAASGELLGERSSGRARILDAAFFPDSRRLATAGEGSTIEIWDPSSEAFVADEGSVAFAPALPTYRELAISPDGAWIAATGYGAVVDVWNAASGARAASLLGHEAMAYEPVFSSDARFLATTGLDGTKRIWHVSSWTNSGVESVRPSWSHLVPFGGHFRASTIGFALDGTAAVASDITLDLATGFRLDERRRESAVVGIPRPMMPDESGYVPAPLPEDIVHTSASGGRRASVSRQGVVLVSDEGTGTSWAPVPADPAIWSAHLSPDGRRLLVGAPDAGIVDASTGAMLVRLAAGDGEPYRANDGIRLRDRLAAWSPDAARVLALRDPLSPCLWDATTGAVLGELHGHTDRVNSVAFSPDGRLVVTASEDHTVRIWEARSGHEVRVLTGHESAVNHARFSPDGNRVVSVSDDGTLRVWDGSSALERARAMHAMLDARERMHPVVERLAHGTPWEVLRTEERLSDVERRAAASLLVDASTERERRYVEAVQSLLAETTRIDQAESALPIIEAELAAHPSSEAVAETHAIALYRAGRFDEARAGLDAIESPSAVGKAFLAMARCRAGLQDAAADALSKLRAQLERPHDYVAKEAAELLREAEALHARTFPSAR